MQSILDTRDIGFQLPVWSTAAGATHTFGAPTGQHLQIEVDGVVFNVTFPTPALTLLRARQEITRQISGMAEAVRVDLSPLASGETLRIRIPPDRQPVGGAVAAGGSFSTFRPRIRLLYQDPTVITAGVDFSILSAATFNTVTTGANGSLVRTASNFATLGVRIGSRVWNRTRSTSADVVAMQTTTNPMDTLRFTSVPAPWTNTDSYDVLPCAEHQDGVGRVGGIYQACLTSNNFTVVTQGGSTQVTLNDLYGEAQGHFEVGQTVFFCCNGAAVIIPVANGGTAGFRLGEQITNSTRGSTGIIRAIDAVGNRLLVDTTSGASTLGTPYTTDPWLASDAIVSAGLGTGSTTQNGGASDCNTGATRVGWMGTCPITAIGQVSATDPRTTLTLNLADVSVNTALLLWPSFSIGSRAKMIIGGVPGGALWPQSSWPSRMIPNLGGTPVFTDDIQRNEGANILTNPHVPDYETGSYQATEIVGHSNTGTTLGAARVWGQLAHMRSMNSRNANPSIGDSLQEDQDSNRVWVPVVAASAPGAGAAALNAPATWVLIGPGGVP